MKSRLSGIVICVLVACSVAGSLAQVPENERPSPRGWFLPTVGKGVGDWSASVGLFAWNNTANLRNLQFRGDVDLAPGLRAHAVIRSDRRLEALRGVRPHFDEGYVEAYGFHNSFRGVLSGSLRVGATRHLRFPYPDAISLFDQVPGVSELNAGPETGYNGALAVLDYAHSSGLGAHFTGIKWGFGREGGSNAIECYGSYRIGNSPRFEVRAGLLPLRPEPLGASEKGYNAFLGINVKNYSVGLLYEKLDHQPAYTGIMIRFAPTRATRGLGTVAFDYDRSPEGVAMQLPLASGRIGNIRRVAPANGALVGEIKAERFKTYWQNGQVRNYYEHRVSS
ncbi:MAG: hypothetical protein Q7T82_10430, partial [Armatimonadota bacterium]|nr:hypothetical protein [Armatimonadota bacterium]